MQRAVTSIKQIGNVENIFDQNTNSDATWSYVNDNSPNNVDAFIGNVLALERCSYVFNFALTPATNTRKYSIKRYALSIEYSSLLLRKET